MKKMQFRLSYSTFNISHLSVNLINLPAKQVNSENNESLTAICIIRKSGIYYNFAAENNSTNYNYIEI